MVDKEVRKPVKKHTRRAALKFLGRAAVGAALWGAGGYLAGKVFNYTAKPLIDLGIAASNSLKKVNPFYRTPRVPTTSRRGFLSSLVRTSYNHPIAAGTAMGVTYGAGKYAISGAGKYLTDRKIAMLQDENTDYKERVKILEDYKEKLEGEMEKRDADVKYLKEELTNVRGILKQLEKPGKLEKKASESDVEITTEEMFLALGLAGLLISFALTATTITGYSVLNENSNQAILPTIGIFLISIFLISKARFFNFSTSK